MEAPLDKPVICVGPPGTGKTVLALYRAAMVEKLRQQPEIVMRSRLLNRYIERSLVALGIDGESRSWHSWVYKHWSKGNGRYRIPELRKFLPDFLKAIELVRERKPRWMANLYWEHLIVDEGQDFPKEFYLYLFMLLQDDAIVAGRRKPTLTVFADENQRLHKETNCTINDIKNYLPMASFFEVKENYRNTARIARLAAHFYVGMSTGIPEIPEHRIGRTPVLRRFDSFDEEMSSIVRWLANNEDLTVGVIVPSIKTLESVVSFLTPLAQKKRLRVQKYRSGVDLDTVSFDEGGTITVVCDESCKGLEFDAVFIPQLQQYRHDDVNEDFFKMKMYVMVSRARSFLQLSFSECEKNPGILRHLPQHNQEVIRWEI